MPGNNSQLQPQAPSILNSRGPSLLGGYFEDTSQFLIYHRLFVSTPPESGDHFKSLPEQMTGIFANTSQPLRSPEVISREGKVLLPEREIVSTPPESGGHFKDIDDEDIDDEDVSQPLRSPEVISMKGRHTYCLKKPIVSTPPESGGHFNFSKRGLRHPDYVSTPPESGGHFNPINAVESPLLRKVLHIIACSIDLKSITNPNQDGRKICNRVIRKRA